MTFLDTLFHIIFKFVSPFLKQNTNGRKEVKKILIVRLAYIGDVALTIPILKPLREKFPNSEISFLVGNAAKEVVTNNPNLNKIICYDAPWFYPQKKLKAVIEYIRFGKMIRREGFDMVIDFRGDFRNILFILVMSGAPHRVGYDITGGGYFLTKIVPYKEDKHKLDFHLDIVRALGANSEKGKIACFPSDHENDKVYHFLSHHKIEKDDLLVGIHPGSRLPLKNWETGKYSIIADTLIREYDAKIIITGNSKEKNITNEISNSMKYDAINSCGLFNLRELSVLMGRFNLFICSDSAPMHLASGANTPIIALFGPSEWRDTGPLSEKSIVQKIDLDCRKWCDSRSCNNINYQYCLKAVQPSDVLLSCRKILSDVYI